jgi:hypothetical protein
MIKSKSLWSRRNRLTCLCHTRGQQHKTHGTKRSRGKTQRIERAEMTSWSTIPVWTLKAVKTTTMTPSALTSTKVVKRWSSIVKQVSTWPSLQHCNSKAKGLCAKVVRRAQQIWKVWVAWLVPRSNLTSSQCLQVHQSQILNNSQSHTKARNSNSEKIIRKIIVKNTCRFHTRWALTKTIWS